MRFRLLFAIFSAAAALRAQVAQTGPTADSKPKARLEGRVLSLTTGEAIRKVTLRLRMNGTVGIATGPVNNSTLVSTSDAEGKFTFEDVDPGRYTLAAERSGFVTQTYSARSGNRGGTPLTLDSGQQIKDIVFKLVPQAVLSGKVVDEDGDPLTGLQIQVFRYTYNRGSRQLQPFGGNNTNPDGTFMIGNLAAGRYFLAAMDMRSMNMGGPQERSTKKGPEEAYVMTYFPNANDASSAAPIDVTAGQEIRGIEIRMRKQPVFSIRGKVAVNAPVQNMALMLISKSNETMFFGRQTSAVRDKEGNFEFRHVVAGSYVIQNNPNMRINGESVTSLAARYEVTVSDHNLEDIAVPLAPLVEITGTLKLEGGTAKPTAPQTQQRSTTPTRGDASGNTAGFDVPQQPNISLNVSQGISFNASNVRANDDGTFQLKNVAPEKYRVNVFGIPDGTYVKSIRFGGQDVTKSELDLTAGSGGTLEILLSATAADVSGVVRDADGKTVGGVFISMWIPGETDQPKAATTDQNGGFRIRNIAPGAYRLVAWEDVEPGLALDPEFRKRFESLAVSVSLQDNSHESVEAKLTPKDVIDAEAAKVK